MKQVEAASPQVQALRVPYNNNISHEQKLGIHFVQTDNEKVYIFMHT